MKKVMKNEEKIEVKFLVDKILYHDQETNFTIIKTTFKKYSSKFVPTSETIVKGHFVSLFVDDEYEGIGHWVRDAIYGWQFVLETHKRVLPSTEKGLRAFLTKFVKGIGTKTANAIVDTYGSETLKKIEEGWENIANVKGIGKKKAMLIHNKYMEHKHYENVAMFVLMNGGGYKTCLKVYEAFGQHAVSKISENPYSLCKIDKIGFLTADKFAKNLGFSYDSQDRIKEAILFYIDQQMQQKGHLYIEKDAIYKEINAFLEKNSAFEGTHELSKDKIDMALKGLEGKVVIEKDEDGERVYLQFFNFIENRIVLLLERLIKQEKTPIAHFSQIQSFINDYEKTGFKFAEAQKEAIFMALQSGFSILTGTPGTGKTQTINSIIKCIQSVKKDANILLAAPTGKASKRVTELTGMEAKTIHRLIGLGMEDKEEELEVESDILIVDEASMIDAYVFYKMLNAISNDTRVLIVGDYEQLPSVGAGLILRDLIASEKIPTTRLTQIFRQAQESQIVMNAHAIIREDEQLLSFDVSKKDCYWIETHAKLRVQEKIIGSIERLITSKRFTLDEIQVLTPIRKGELGTADLNRLIQEKFNKRTISKREYNISPILVFREGDKVMQTVNNYDLDVFNGEVGKIASIEDGADGLIITVDFGDKEVEYDEIQVEELELAYAISIHKSQGSEFKCVIMPVHESQEFMLNKNLIYTGLTRAKEMATMIGQRDVMNQVIKKNDNTIRNSRIKEKVIKAL